MCYEFVVDFGFVIGGNVVYLWCDGSECFIGEWIEDEVVVGEVLL